MQNAHLSGPVVPAMYRAISEHTFMELFNRRRNEDDAWLIGEGFLNKGQAIMLSAAPGVGKSAFTFHLVCNLALGRSFVGLKPVKELKVLYYQNEDTEDDLRNYANGFGGQNNLGNAEVNTLDDNLVIRTATGVSGDAFIEELEAELCAVEPDILVIDPLFSFIGANVADQVSMSKFLREQMATLLRKYKCGWICVHHNNRKDNNNSGFKAFGSIELAAYFRGIIELTPLKGNEVKLEIVKRARQAGLCDSYGKPIDTLHLVKGTDAITWNISTSQPAAKTAIIRTGTTASIGRPPTVSKEEMAKFIRECRGAGQNDSEVRRAIKSKFGYCLKQAGRILEEHNPVPGASSGEGSA